MIDYLRGSVVRVEPDFIVVDVHGIGYRVFCANPYAFRAEERETVVYTHYHVREDAIQLFGFASREEQSAFRLLLDVSGIGPRVALGVLSGGSPDALVAAIRREDLSYLTRLPGVGKKTAQRMVLELKDKLKGDAWAGFGEDGAQGVTPHSSATGDAGGEPSGPWQEAKEALAALGFTDGEIAAVQQDVLSEAGAEAGAEVLMKAALQRLYKR